MTVQSQLAKAFKSLRTQGFIARRSFMCCSCCASAILAREILALHRDGATLPLGAIYYTRQDAESFSTPRRGNLMIRFGRITARYGDLAIGTPRSTREVAIAALQALQEAGLRAQWSGKDSECIEVVIPREAL